MELKNTLIAVKNIDESVNFYKEVLGLDVILDFGANKTLTGGLVLQTLETYEDFIKPNDISFGGNDMEIYFEEDDFDEFCERIKLYKLTYVTTLTTHSWGQRVVRFYDLDHHIIEVGENLKSVCKRFYNDGLSNEEIAKRMDVPLSFVEASLTA